LIGFSLVLSFQRPLELVGTRLLDIHGCSHLLSP
jgi:hypothetical protein